MTDEPAVQALPERDFSGSELAVLRELKIEPTEARVYPARFGVRGVAELVAAGISAEQCRSIDPMLTPAAIVAFHAGGLPLDDTEYDERFFDPAMLAEAGVSASRANAYPEALTDVDVVRLHEAGAAPDVADSFAGSWDPVETAKLVASGLTAEEAEPYRHTSFVPADCIAPCVKAGADPERLDHWIEVVSSAVRTESRILVSMALDAMSLDDPERFRAALLLHAVEAVQLCDGTPDDLAAVGDALVSILERDGEVSTSVPSSWNKQRLLHVGPASDLVAELGVVPGEALRFSYGEVTVADGLAALEGYAGQLR